MKHAVKYCAYLDILLMGSIYVIRKPPSTLPRGYCRGSSNLQPQPNPQIYTNSNSNQIHKGPWTRRQDNQHQWSSRKTYIHTYIHIILICICIYIYISIYAYICVCVYIYICVCVHICICIHKVETERLVAIWQIL